MLQAEGYHLRYASSATNKLVRLADMLWMTIRNSRWSDFVLIDTYSTWNFWYSFAVSQLCRLLNRNYILILHGGNLPQRLKKNPTLCRMVFKNAFQCVAPSRYLVTAFKREGYDIVHIPNPVDTAQFKFKHRESIGPKLIWVRSLDELYNPEMALRVLRDLKKNFPEVSLVMVGPDRGKLESLQKFAKENQLDVVFTGKLSKHQWAQLADDCDILLNTSTVDNAPFSILEALALGLFVVSTDVGGIPFLIEHERHGLLVGSGESKAMAHCVRRLVENSELRKVLSVESKILITDSSLGKVGEKWNEILH